MNISKLIGKDGKACFITLDHMTAIAPLGEDSATVHSIGGGQVTINLTPDEIMQAIIKGHESMGLRNALVSARPN